MANNLHRLHLEKTHLLALLLWALLAANLILSLDFPEIPLKTMFNLPHPALFSSQLLDYPINQVMPLTSFVYDYAMHLPFGLEMLPQATFLCLVSLLLLGAGMELQSLLSGIIASLLFLMFLHNTPREIALDSYTYTEEMLANFIYSLVVFALLIRARNTHRRLSTELLVAITIGFAFMVKSSLSLLPPVLVGYDILTGKLHKGETSWKLLALLCLLPYAMLLPWVYMNWQAYHVLTVFEYGRASQNIISGSLGIVHTMEGAYAAVGLTTDKISAIWVAKTIMSNPLIYLSAVLQRIYLEFSWHPAITTLFLGAVWLCRHHDKFRFIGLFALYYVAIHSLLSICQRYFYPLWPTIILGAGALLSARMLHLPQETRLKFSQSIFVIFFSQWPRDIW